MDKKAFYAALRKRDSGLFGTSLSQGQVEGVDGVLDAFETHGDGRADTLAYALATAYHETARAMVPIKETVMPYHKDKKPSDDEVIRRLDNWARKKGRKSNIYWRRIPPYNQAYFGRGQVQLTWDYNYEGSSEDAGVDLLKNPNAMLDPEISARVLFRGLLDGRWNGRGEGLRYYLDQGDMKNARRTVNVTDKWDIVSGYHISFLEAIEAAGGVAKKRPIESPKADPAPDPQEEAPGGWAALLSAILSMFRSRS